MDDLRLLVRYATRALIWIAPLEFLLGRAIARTAKEMPAGEIGAAVFGAISTAGAFLVMPAFLLVALVVSAGAWLALRRPAAGGMLPRPLAALVLVLVLLSLALLFPGAPAPILITYNGVSAACILGLAGWFVVRGAARRAVRLSVGLFGLAYLGYYLYALSALAGPGAGLGDLSVWASALGEAAGMLAAISLLWTTGLAGAPPGALRPRTGWLLLAGLAGVVVLAGSLFESWLQGVISQFSVGFTLFLPVPISALALAAWVYGTLAANARDATARLALPWAWELGAGLLLLPAAGYQLQLNYQHLLLAAVLLLWTGALRPFSAAVPEDSLLPETPTRVGAGFKPAPTDGAIAAGLKPAPTEGPVSSGPPQTARRMPRS